MFIMKGKAMKYAVPIVLSAFISTGCWTEQEVVSNVTTDTDTDSDSDTDSDTGSDSESASDIDTETDWCTAPEGITDWGGPCHTNADCPPNTECITLSGMDDTQGFCSAECCNFSTPDTDYCTDVAAGQESCSIMPGSSYYGPPYHCLIICNTQADCPTGTDCVEAGGNMSICYGYAS